MPWPTFSKKDEIPDPFRSEYEERDGQWHPKLPDVTKLEGTLATVRAEKKDAEKAAREAAERAADLQRQLDAKAATGQETDKKVSEMLDKWKKEKDDAVAAVAKERDEARAQLRTVKLDDKIRAAFLKAGGRAEKADAALRLTKESFDLADDDRIVVKDAKGEVTTATVEDFFGKTYRGEMPEFYTGTKASGGGATGGAGSVPAKGDPSAADRVLADPLAVLNEANLAASSR